MMQALLAGRFAFWAPRGQRTLDGYALVQAKAGVLGPALKPSDIDCEKNFASKPKCWSSIALIAPALTINPAIL